MAIIMISRGTLSGGKAVAERVADRLGYPCLSREETVREVIEKYGISEKEKGWMSQVEEMGIKDRFWIVVVFGGG